MEVQPPLDCAALNQPDIVTLHSTEESDGVRFMTMDLIEGQTLDRKIPTTGVSLARFSSQGRERSRMSQGDGPGQGICHSAWWCDREGPGFPGRTVLELAQSVSWATRSQGEGQIHGL